MTKNKNARNRNNKRKASPCNEHQGGNGGGKVSSAEYQIEFEIANDPDSRRIEVRSSEKLQATRLCTSSDNGGGGGGTSDSTGSPPHDFTLCDLIFDGASSRVCLPRELWENDLSESVSSAVLHLLYGAADAVEGGHPLEVLHSVPWLASGRHAVLVPDHGHPALVADFSAGGDHEDHNEALTLQEEIPLKKCRLPKFAVHQTMATLTVVFFVQNVDRRSVAATFCTCNSLFRLEFCLNSEHHTTYRVALGHPSLESALAFPQGIRVEVVRDSALVIYLDKADDAHVLWTEMAVGAAGTGQLKIYPLVDGGEDSPTSPYLRTGIL